MTMQKKSFRLLKVCVAFSLLLANLGNIFRVNAAPVEFPSKQNYSSFDTQTSELPHVVTVTPDSGFLKKRNAPVTVTFDVPMDQARTQAAFSIQPNVPHRFTWKNPTTLQIHFSELFHPGTPYALTIIGGAPENAAQSRDGATLSEDYRWYYWLDAFQINVASPSSTQITLNFNTTLDKNKSGLPFEIQPHVAGEWKWTNEQVAFFTATNGFLPAQKYSVNLSGPLYDQFGEVLYDGPELAFNSPPPIRSIEPKEGTNVSADFGPIQIIFTEPVDRESAQQAFTITPEISGRFTWSKSNNSTFEDTLSFMPDTLFETGREYTVSLSPSLKARAGTPLMLESYQWTFSVDQYYYPYHAPAAFGEVGSNVQVVDANGPRKVQFSASTEIIQFEIYRYDLIDYAKLYAEDANKGYGLHPISLPAEEEERLVTSWYYTGENRSGTIDETIIPPDVPPGLYVLNIKHEGRSYSQLFVILSRNTIVAKRSGDELFVWVSNINGESVPDAEVRLYSDHGEKIREGKTDEQGIYRVTVPVGYNPMLVSAKQQDKKESDVTITGLDYDWSSSESWRWSPSASTKNLVYTYTDRPIYRPGQTVNFKSILRDDHDVKYSLLPSNTQVMVNIRDPKNNLLQSTQTQLSQFGTLNGSFTIAEGAMLGSYEIDTLVNGESTQQIFKVEDYRKPDFKVTLTPSDPDQGNLFIAGQRFDLDIDVRYFFDEPVAGAKLTYSYYELRPYYDWWNPNPEGASYSWMPTASQAQKSSQKTAEDGTGQISLKPAPDSQAFEYSSFDDWQSSLRTKTYAVEVTVDDGSNQPVSGTYIYKVTNANEKFSLNTNGYFKKPNSPFMVEASVKDLLDSPVAGREMTLEVKKWNNTSYDYELVGKGYPLTSDSNGLAKQELALEPGYYTLFLSGKDVMGNTVSYKHWIGIFSTGADWLERRNTEIRISAEKEMYKPYETARFRIESGFSGPALLTFERGSVVHTKQVVLTAPITVVDAQIIPEDAPNIFVTINAWEPTKRMDTQGEYTYYSNIPDSHLRMARTELLVEADTKSLDIAISTDQLVYKPGEQITVNLDVKNNRNQPVEAEVSLALVDEAIFSLSNELSANIFQAFYGPRSLSVDTYDSLSPYRVMMEGGMGGGGDEMVAEPRRDFPDTAAWYPTLITDENGHASITFNLPDNLTSWRLTAKAITLNHQVGEARANIETKKDLMLRPFLPRVLTTGDQAELSVMVHNYSGEEHTVKVTLQAQHLQIQDAVTQSVTIPAAGSKLVGWSIVPTGTTEIPLTFSAVADDQLQDSIQVPLAIQPLAVADVQSLSGTFNESISLDLVRPTDALADNSLVTLRLSKSPASSLLDGLEYLTGYPYGCVEQTMSRAMPNAVLGRASTQLGIGGEGFQTRIDPLIAASIQKLYGFQHEDGGWGWWFDDRSDDYQTAWVLHGLAVIQSSGTFIEPLVIENAVKYLNANLTNMDVRTKAYALFSMALVGKANLDATRTLADTALQQLDPFSQAALALALKQLGEDTRAAAIIDGLEGFAMQKGGFAYWPQSQADGEYHRKTMASTVRTTAFVLSAILGVDGEANPLAKPAADFLISKRNGYGWGTTNETSFTILALTDYLLSQQTETGTSEFTVKLNDSDFSTGVLEPGKMFYKVEIPFSLINSGSNKLELVSSSNSPLYYDLVTRYTLSRQAVESAGNITVTRQYLNPNTKEPLEKVIAGQLVHVELTVKIPQTGSFMLIEDHLPGGLEALNEGLNTTSHVSLYYDGYYDYNRYLWEDYGYNNKEIHGDKVSFFITDMRSGTTILSYLARATNSGTFIALPTEASAMYDSLLWGRSSNAIFIVEEQPS